MIAMDRKQFSSHVALCSLNTYCAHTVLHIYLVSYILAVGFSGFPSSKEAQTVLAESTQALYRWSYTPSPKFINY